MSMSGEFVPWNLYPRPTLVRDSFFCLNGNWEFAASETKVSEYDMKITVPYPPESKLSGLNKHFPQTYKLFYKKVFSLPDGFVKDRVILHFGAVDQIVKITLNGKFIGSHEGGYEHFSFDITDFLKDLNTLEVEVSDELNTFRLPYGKQCEKRGGMWYTPVTGIWQTVWIESVPQNYISDIKITTTLNEATVEIEPKTDATLLLGDESYEIKNGTCTVTPKEIINWTPETPHLYNFKIKTQTDKISSYFALRTVDIQNIGGVNRICLNSKPYFFHGLLDQGYFMDGIFLPEDSDGYQKDILAVKKLGFNTLRKHIKIEPDVFYYYCDKLGMVVFQDMVNNGDYSFLRDTALPTTGFKRRNDKKLHKDKQARKAFENSMLCTVKQLSNFPSICMWTIFNEGWGQFEGTKMYRLLKNADPTRIIDTASGWFIGAESDVESPHVYFKKHKFKKSSKPVVLSEFGGYTLRIDGHGFNTKKTYGYKLFKSKTEYNNALKQLYLRDVIPFVKQGLCGAVYTQISDVEDEMNGLLTYDRMIQKADTDTMKFIAQRLHKENGEIK